MRKAAFLCLFYLAFGPHAALPAYGDTDLRDLRLKQLSQKDGLSSPYITGIFQDHHGFVWIGTDGGGLNRFDGAGFLHFRRKREDPASLASDHVTKIVEDSQGVLWVATGNAGLNRLNRDGRTFTLYLHNPGDEASIPHNRIRDILEDSRGNLWFATDGGLALYLRETDSFRVYKHDPGDPGSIGGSCVTCLFEDSSGNLWTGAAGLQDEPGPGHCGLSRYDYHTDSFARFLHVPSDTLTAMAEDFDGSLWLVNRGGIDRFDPDTGVLHHYPYPPGSGDFAKTGEGTLPDGAAGTCALMDSRGVLWIGGGGGLGLLVYDRANDGFIRHAYSPDLPAGIQDRGNSVTSLLEDDSGTVWIATGNGIHLLPAWRRRFSTFLPGKWILTFAEDPFGALWIAGTEKGYRYDPEADSVEEYLIGAGDPENPLESRTGALGIASDGSGYASGFEGLFILDRPQNRFELFLPHGFDDPGALNSGPHPNLVEDGAGILWTGTARGVDAIDPVSRTVTHYTLAGRWPVLFLDYSGRLWAGTRDSGLFLLDRRQNRFLPLEEVAEIRGRQAGERIWCLREDQRGGILVGSDGGIDRFDPESGEFRHFGIEEGFPAGSTVSIEVDKGDALWFSTASTIYRYTRDTGDLRYIVSAEDAGLEQFLGNSSFRSSTGELYFGGSGGFVRLDPSGYAEEVFHPQVALTSFRLFEEEQKLARSICDTSKLALSWRDTFFAFEFAAFDFNAPEKIEYAYMLEGWDDDWIHAGSRRYAGYTNIPGGDYTFVVKATNADGVWTTEANRARVDIHIATHPLKTRYAVSGYMLLSLGLVAGAFFRYRSVQQRKLLQERRVSDRLRHLDRLKDEFLANTSHELRTPLNGIIGIAETLIAEAPESLSDNTRKELSLIVSSGRRLSCLINDILDFSRLKEGDITLDKIPVDLARLVNTVLVLSKPLGAGKPLQLVNAVPADLPTVMGDVNRIEQVLHNLVHNAVKFTREGSVTVRARKLAGAGDGASGSGAAREAGFVEVAVADTGIGIPAAEQADIWLSFRQAAAEAGAEAGGSGLGLAITKKLVELHGGEIRLSSEEGKGSVFFFTLPAAPETGAPQTAAAAGLRTVSAVRAASEIEPAPPAGPAGSEGPRTRILFVDDEAINRHVVERQLAGSGYALLTAAGGEEALRRIGAEFPPDLVLLDIMMPGMDGYEVCRKIRLRYSALELPVIMLTAKNQVADLVEGLSAGANDFISKPHTQDELLARIKSHLKTARASYDRFVPKDLLALLGKGGSATPEPGEHAEKRMTILLLDLVRDPAAPQTETLAFLTAFLPCVLPVVRSRHGIVYRYEGEAVMSFFPGPAAEALKAAVEIQEQAARYAREHKLKKTPPAAAVLHSGKFLIGTAGDNIDTMETVLSETVRETFKLRDLARRLACPLVATEPVAAEGQEPCPKRLLGYLSPGDPAVYEILAGTPELTARKMQTRDSFEAGVEFFYGLQFDEASVCFGRVLKANPEDRAAVWYREASIRFQKTPPAGMELP
jgi:two-component system sensor histidine kinase ChiS